MGLLAPGATVAGYRIESVVGRGGMGVVYRACELGLDRQIALKVIAPELLEDADIRLRFLKEARTAASIEHPHVIPVYAAGERDGAAYIAMRFIEGDDVRTLVRRQGPLAPARAADLTAQAAAGLDAIHRAGYVHRDVKPANVLVDRDGHVYITDFGLAKQMLSQSGATHTGQWVGTLDYVAPEQIRGGRIDARADVYALGGVLSFVLTGRVPFERELAEAKVWAQLSAPAPVPSRLLPGLPVAFDAIVARAMAKTAEDRYPSAGDLGRAAAAALSGAAPSQPERMVARGAAAPGGAASEPGLADGDSELTVTRPEAGPAAPRGPRRPRRTRRVIVAVAAVALAATVAAVALLPRDTPQGAGARGRAGPVTPHVTKTIQNVGQRPNGIVVAGGELWVTSSGRTQIDRFDVATGRELADHPPVGPGASSIVVAGGSVWVAAKDARRVDRIDALTARPVAPLAPGGPPYRLATGLGSLWVATSRDPRGGDQLVRYDLAGHEQDRWTMPRGVVGLAVGADAVWAAERDVASVLRMDPRTGRLVLWAKLAGPATGLYFGAGYLWATLNGLDSVARIDPRRRTQPVTTAAGHRPAGMVAAGSRLFVASTTDHTVVVINPLTARQDGSPLRVALNPFAIAADADSVWVTGLGENTLTRIAYR